jgi:subtilase family serine protease
MPEDRDDTTTGDANISVTIESLTRATATGSSAGASSDPSYVRHSNAWDILERMDTELAKLGLRGVTVVAASGDNGPFSYGIPNPYAAWAVKDAPCGFGPSFPGSMPHVTAVRGPEP